MLPSSFLGELLAACGAYQDVWCERDERGNPSQTFYRDMIQQEKEREVSGAMRGGGVSVMVQPASTVAGAPAG